MDNRVYHMFTYWACLDHEQKPLGYVRAQTQAEAISKAEANWPDEFDSCQKWDGVL